jgi:hypothetical protein
MFMILGQFMQMESLEVKDDQIATNGHIKQMVHQVHAKSFKVSTVFMNLCCSYDFIGSLSFETLTCTFET